MTLTQSTNTEFGHLCAPLRDPPSIHYIGQTNDTVGELLHVPRSVVVSSTQIWACWFTIFFHQPKLSVHCCNRFPQLHSPHLRREVGSEAVIVLLKYLFQGKLLNMTIDTIALKHQVFHPPNQS